MTAPPPVPGQAFTGVAAPHCEHYWAFRVHGALSVRLCMVCHEPDWEDVRRELDAAVEAAAPAIREAERRRWRAQLDAVAAEWENSAFAQMDRGYAADVLRRMLQLDTVEHG